MKENVGEDVQTDLLITDTCRNLLEQVRLQADQYQLASKLTGSLTRLVF